MKNYTIVFLTMFFVLNIESNCFGDNLSDFLKIVKPKFDTILGDTPELKNKLQATGEKPYDTLTYAYRLSVRKTEYEAKMIIPLGKWSRKIEDNFFIFLSILCPIKDLLHIRKTEDYEKNLNELRPILTKGAYKHMVQQLTVSSKAFHVKLWELKEKDMLSDKNAFLLKEGINLLRKEK